MSTCLDTKTSRCLDVKTRRRQALLTELSLGGWCCGHVGALAPASPLVGAQGLRVWCVWLGSWVHRWKQGRSARLCSGPASASSCRSPQRLRWMRCGDARPGACGWRGSPCAPASGGAALRGRRDRSATRNCQPSPPREVRVPRLLRERRCTTQWPPEACAKRLGVSTRLACLLLLDGVELTAEVIEVPASVSACGGVGRGDAAFSGPPGQRRRVHAQLSRSGGSGQKALRHGRILARPARLASFARLFGALVLLVSLAFCYVRCARFARLT